MISSGHGTYEDDGELVATVGGVVEEVKLKMDMDPVDIYD